MWCRPVRMFYANTCHPSQAGSTDIDGTDTTPHDNAVRRALIASTTHSGLCMYLLIIQGGGQCLASGYWGYKADYHCPVFCGARWMRYAVHATGAVVDQLLLQGVEQNDIFFCRP